jgi:signal transduction histidine kinase
MPQRAAKRNETRPAAEIVSFGRGRFRPRARLIRTIGAELISSEIVAVLELVRNSYDADARRVLVRFGSPHLPEEASLEILDDGHGMAQEVLLGPWLEPATDFKVSGGSHTHGGERSPRGRRRLGSKGVGRFAAQRLGRRLMVQTSNGRQPTVLEADFDWDRLDRGDKYLDQLTVPWREIRSRSGRWHGTSLSIGLLRDRWIPARFDRLRLALSRLLGPGLGTNPFAIELDIDGSVEQIRPAIDQLPAMYTIRGDVGIGGSASVTYSDIFGVQEGWERSVLWPSAGQTCGAFKFRVNAWDLDREALGFFLEKNALGLGPRDFRRTIRDHSGISLYRDGFRMLPYGEPDNDWLRLDRRRVNNPTLRLSNNQILGWVQISADGNPNLQDQTNREGLVSNDAYTHLQHVILELLSYFEARRFASRRSAPMSSGSRATSLPIASTTMERIDALLTPVAGRQGLGPTDAERIREAFRTQQDASADALRRYAGLAATGQLASAVFARILQPLRQVQTELTLISSEIEAGDALPESRDDIKSALQRASRRLQEVQHIVDRLDPLARPRKGRKLVPLDLEACISDVVAVFSDEIGQKEIDFQLVARCEASAYGDISIIEQVLAILFDNAISWLAQVSPPRRLRIELLEDGFVIENNGPPIAEEHRALVFEPHFTTREEASGMGLTLAQDLLRAIGGHISLVGRRQPVAFRIQLRQAGSGAMQRKP